MANLDGPVPATPVSPEITKSVADAVAGTGGVPVAPASAEVPVGTGRYVLSGEIARGGMGVIYRATDTALDREVAVKVLHDKHNPDSGAARRFADEARITAQLQHPGIPPVHDLGTLPDGRPFLAMKLIKGATLDRLMEARQDPSAERGRFVAVFEQICQALAYAHSHDVIHRDLKPQNVMVGAFGEVQVMDWGLAKVLTGREGERPEADPQETTAASRVVSLRDSDGSFTQAGSVLGTPAYMPPEQALGAVHEIDRRSDVFGLGGILAVVLTGRPPFVAETAETTRVMAARGEVTSCFARLDGSGADPELAALCKRCLAPKREERPADAGEVARAVAELRSAAEERARRSELERVKAEGEKAAAELQAAEQRKRRRVQLGLAAAVGLVVLLSGVGVVVIRSQSAARRADADNLASAALGRAEQLAIQGAALDPGTPAEARSAIGVWESAEAAVAQAEAPVAGCSVAVAARVSEKAREVRDGLARARRDADLLQGLAAMRTTAIEQRGGSTDCANMVRVFRSALVAAGLPARLAGAEDVSAAVAAIQGERPGVRTALRSAIDFLLAASPQAGFHADFEFAAWLEAANRCDDNPFRREVRGKFVQVALEKLIRIGWPISPLAPSRAEPPVSLPDLLRLADRAEAEDPPVDAVVLLSAAIDQPGEGSDKRLRRLLQVARDRHPNDPGLQRAFAVDMGSVWRATKEPRAFAEALGGYRACIALRPDDAHAYYNLGGLLHEQGDNAGAAAAYRAAIARNPKLNFARINLAWSLEMMGDLDGAIAILRETIQLDPGFDMAHSKLEDYLRQKRLRELLPRLAGILAGTDRPASPAEALSFAVLCYQAPQRRYAAAVRLSEEAFAADSGAGDGPSVMFPDLNTNRYDAACSAALAGGGAGVDAPADAAGRAALRAKALVWLRADLSPRQKQAASAKPDDRREAAGTLAHWLTDTDLAEVRALEPLAKLPSAEREKWEKLWVDVKATLAEARKPVPPPKTEPKKQ